VADERSIAGKMSVVRLVNAQKLPYNDDIGWTVATPNPLYVQGSYNTTLDGTHYSLGLGATTNGYTVPAALICDALTLLSSNWSDALSYGPVTGRNSPSALTLNAAIITGNIPSTGTSATTFSGGVHNLTRFLEIWTGVTVTYNTSIVCLYQSQTANAQFLMPYNAVSTPMVITIRPPVTGVLTRRFTIQTNSRQASLARKSPSVSTGRSRLRARCNKPPNPRIASRLGTFKLPA
jgi:hypothetical protein